MPETSLDGLASVHNVTPAQLAQDIYNVCRWMQDNGKHYNVGTNTFANANEREDTNIPFYFMNRDVLTTELDEILFYSPASRRSDFHGWAIKKRPVTSHEKYGEVWAWERNWASRYGELVPDLLADIEKRIDAIENAEAAKPQRKHDRPELENITTLEVAHRWATASLMRTWMQTCVLGHYADRRIFGYLGSIFTIEQVVYAQELEYRTAADPEKRSSLKKTEEARRDFRKASEFLAAGPDGIYSKEFINQALNAEFPISLAIDPEVLPKPPAEKAPVMRMGYTDLMHEFIRWVTANEIDPASFEYEDATHLRNKLHTALDETRKQFARAKGQHVDSDE